MVSAAFLLILLTGCVPIPVYQELQKKMSSVQEEKNNLKKKLEQCEGKIKKLQEDMKMEPPKQTINQKPLAPSELEEIKRKALDDTEKRFQLRIRQKAQ